MSDIKLLHGDCLEQMKKLEDNSVDSIVCDPPYGLSFMGKKWDYEVPSVEIWEEALRVLKPGGHLLAFAGTRTQHRMAVNIEDAGFEIRDMIAWAYGCLSEDTEILTSKGWIHYHKNIESDLVLCYNHNDGTFKYEHPTDKFFYKNEHTAYRIESVDTDQIVSRNHRVLVERDGREVFVKAEALEHKENIPVLENVSVLQSSIHCPDNRASLEEQVLREELHQENDKPKENREKNSTGRSEGGKYIMSSVSESGVETRCVVEKGRDPDVLPTLQWNTKGARVEETRKQGKESLDRGEQSEVSGENDWKHEPVLEGGCDTHKKEGEIRRSENKICEVSKGIHGDVQKGWVCNGTQDNSSDGDWETADENGMRSSHKSRCYGQQDREFDAIQDELGSQEIRTRAGYKTTLATITPIEYNGNVWCVTVPTGAFVARRNGKVFITGNSGFPKSLSISKAIDKVAGAEREVVGKKVIGGNAPDRENFGADDRSEGKGMGFRAGEVNITAPATDEAKKWDGWGSSLKPAIEPITLARKPLGESTIAKNVLKWGTGGINIDESRVDINPDVDDPRLGGKGAWGTANAGWVNSSPEAKSITSSEQGRFPANLILSDCEEVKACFPETKPSKSTPRNNKPSDNKSMSGANLGQVSHGHNASGSASRFFKSIIYQAKPSKKERNQGCEGMEEKNCDYDGRRGQNNSTKRPDGSERKENLSKNNHPTVKPVALMEYLVNMVTPKGGVCLDPFMGSGTTGMACKKLGFSFIGCEMDEEYIKIAEARINSVEVEETN